MSKPKAKRIWETHERGCKPIKVRGAEIVDGQKRVVAAQVLGFTWINVVEVE